MSSFLIYFASFGFCIGIFARTVYHFGLPAITAVLVISFALGLLWQRRNVTSSAPYLLSICLFLFLFSCGALRMEIASWYDTNPNLEQQLNTTIRLEGLVVREPDIRQSNQQLFIKTNNGLLLVLADKYTPVAYGDTVTFSGTLQKPDSFETDFGRTFNYGGYLRAKGVSYTVSFAEVTVNSSGHRNIVIVKLLDFKHAFIRRIESVIPHPEVGLGEGLLLGVNQALGDDIESAFRTVGITHIVVLSGYNVMIVVAFILYVLAIVLPLRARLIFGAIAVVFFACLVGFSATVVRASCMAILTLIAKATGRTYAVIRGLILTGVVMLLFNPYLLVYDVGFQLSFVATLGLILLAPYIETHLGFMPKLLGMREILTATLSAQVFVMPILLYQIGQFSVVAVIVNVLVLPMVSLAMLLTFITGMIGFISTTLSLPFAYLASLSLSYILFIAQKFAQLPFASFIVPAFPFYLVMLAYGALGALLLYVRTHKNIKTESLSNWIIEDEEVFILKIKKVPTKTHVRLPIFFR